MQLCIQMYAQAVAIIWAIRITNKNLASEVGKNAQKIHLVETSGPKGIVQRNQSVLTLNLCWNSEYLKLVAEISKMANYETTEIIRRGYLGTRNTLAIGFQFNISTT